MPGVEITGNVVPRSEEILTQQALDLIALLHRTLNPRRLELLAARKVRMQQIADGKDFDFLAHTKAIRDDKSWKVAPAAPHTQSAPRRTLSCTQSAHAADCRW